VCHIHICKGKAIIEMKLCLLLTLLNIAFANCSDNSECVCFRNGLRSCLYTASKGVLSKPGQFINAHDLYLLQARSDAEKKKRAEIWDKTNVSVRKRAQLALDLKVLRQRFLHYKTPHSYSVGDGCSLERYKLN
jgi:hypothetical protein